VALTDVFDTMQIYLGSLYVNDSTVSVERIRCGCKPMHRSARAPKTSGS